MNKAILLTDGAGFIKKSLEKSYIFKKDDPFSSHNRIAKKIVVSGKKSLLDVGCNKGFIGKALTKRGWRGKISGLDKEVRFKNIVNKNSYYNFQLIDMEKNLNKLKGRFDIIVLGDVLEHLVDPPLVLARLKQNLNNNGLVIMSLPNVANIYIRLSLLLGKFEYSDRGILDKDHKRFYTKETATRMIVKSGLKIVECDITPIPLPLIHRAFSCRRSLFGFYYLFNLLTKIKPSLLAYQFIFICQNND